MKLNQFKLINFANRDNNLFRLIIMLIAVFALMSTLRPSIFPKLDNFTSMAYQFPEYGVLAIAMMLSLLIGGVDLSIVGIANLSAILAAKLLIKFVPYDADPGYTLLMIGVAIIVALAIGALCGAFNGFIISKFGIPDILATLGSMQLFTGIAIVITKGRIVVGIPYMYSELGNAAIGGIIPVPLIIYTICAVLIGLLLNKTSFGIKLYMMGTNPTASRFSGINNAIMTIRSYMYGGILSAVAGLIMLARTNSAKADFGSSYILQTVLIGVLGGVNPSGGFGTVGGVTVAILILQFLSSGFNMFPSISNLIKDLIWGSALILVMVFNYYSNKRSEKAQISKRIAETTNS
ncbi:MAG: simple sugar transport system permease protein [Halanaerobiales bacterium]|nr:simple sugar transport system permease protein [Halanaerobiales bacterium]